MKKKGRLHRFLVVSYETAMAAVLSLPRYGFCNALKAGFLRACGARIGRRVTIYPGVWISPARNLVVGDEVNLAHGVFIDASEKVTIGDRTLVGYRSMILSANHAVPPGGGRIVDHPNVCAAISIAQDAWLGARCIVLPGVAVGEGAVVAAGAVVTRDVPPFTVVAGVPARKVRERARERGDAPPSTGQERRG